MSTADTEARMWVGCLTCHESGYPTGQWFDATDRPPGGIDERFAHVVPDPLPREVKP